MCNKCAEILYTLYKDDIPPELEARGTSGKVSRLIELRPYPSSRAHTLCYFRYTRSKFLRQYGIYATSIVSRAILRRKVMWSIIVQYKCMYSRQSGYRPFYELRRGTLLFQAQNISRASEVYYIYILYSWYTESTQCLSFDFTFYTFANAASMYDYVNLSSCNLTC